MNVINNNIAFLNCCVCLNNARVSVFGFWKGTFLSFVGEAVGAIVSFLWVLGRERAGTGHRNMEIEAVHLGVAQA